MIITSDDDNSNLAKKSSSPPSQTSRSGLSFYGIRHSYYTSATGSFDTEACKLSIGHAIPGMGRHYIEARAQQWDERLARVADHVHGWLFSPETD